MILLEVFLKVIVFKELLVDLIFKVSSLNHRKKKKNTENPSATKPK